MNEFVILALLLLGSAPAQGVAPQKLRLEDFFPSARYPYPAFTDESSWVLGRGREINLVLDYGCLKKTARISPGAPWAKSVTVDSVRLRAALDGPAPHSHHWVLERDWTVKDLRMAIDREPCVNMVGPDINIWPAAVTSDPALNQQHHLRLLGFESAFRVFFPMLLLRRSAVIAIVDTGVELKHPDLVMNIWRNTDERPDNGRDDDRNGYIDDYHGYNFISANGNAGPEGGSLEIFHGTHVAGLAAARLDNSQGGTGINGVAKIMSLNVFGPRIYTKSSVLENAIRYAADNGADVINLSLAGREYSRTMLVALQYAVVRGSFIAAAAGNEGLQIMNDPESLNFMSPAAYGGQIEGMMTVAALDVVGGRLSSFSNFAPDIVEIAAPGAYRSSLPPYEGLYSTVLGGTYGWSAGTSMAAPLVAGAAALVEMWMKSYRYSDTPATIERVLGDAAFESIELEGAVRSGRSLNLLKLGEYLQRNFPARPRP